MHKMLLAPPWNLSGVESEDLARCQIEIRFTSERYSFRLKMGLSGAVNFLTCCHRRGHAVACRKPGPHDVAEDLGTTNSTYPGGRWGKVGRSGGGEDSDSGGAVWWQAGDGL